MIQQKAIRERDFHNQRFANDHNRRRTVGRFYQVASSIKSTYHAKLLENCAGSRIVEYGCGTGSQAFALARNGAIVTGIDISEVALQLAAFRAADEGVHSKTAFVQMNAENLAFQPHSFDLICGSGILHHLDLEESLRQIVHSLHQGGRAVFIEPLGHNVFINMFRSLTPGIRTEDEHPLLDKDLETFKHYFRKVELRFFYLSALLAAPFANLPGFNLLLAMLEKIDRLLFTLPFLRRQAWQVLIELSEPIRPVSSSQPV